MKNIAARIFNTLIFMATFVLVGTLLPYLYYEYVDQTNYYHIEVPVMTTEKEYKPCDTVIVPVTRKSLVDKNGELRIELIRVENDKNYEVETTKYEVLIEEGTQTRLVQQQIPCNEQPGFYFLKGRISFEVHGVERFYEFTTNTFEVRQ
jgi:hypothetical protein